MLVLFARTVLNATYLDNGRRTCRYRRRSTSHSHYSRDRVGGNNGGQTQEGMGPRKVSAGCVGTKSDKPRVPWARKGERRAAGSCATNRMHAPRGRGRVAFPRPADEGSGRGGRASWSLGGTWPSASTTTVRCVPFSSDMADPSMNNGPSPPQRDEKLTARERTLDLLNM